MFFDKKNKEKSVLPFLEGLAFPLEKIFSNFREFAMLICSASLVTTAFCYWLMLSFSCEKYAGDVPICSYSPYRMVVFLLLILFLEAAVYSRWQSIFSENMKFLDTFKKEFFFKDLKAMLILFLYFIFWCGVIGGLFWLDIRKPVADWHMEALFFVGVSSIIIISILFLFNFAVFQHFFKGGKFFAINKTFIPIFDNIYKPFTWFLIYFLVIVILLKQVFAYVFYNSNISGDFATVLKSFCFSAIFYIIVALLSGSLFYQEKQLFAEEK